MSAWCGTGSARGERANCRGLRILSPTNAPAIPRPFDQRYFARRRQALVYLQAGRPAGRAGARYEDGVAAFKRLSSRAWRPRQRRFGMHARSISCRFIDHSTIRSRRMSGHHRADLPALCPRREQRRCDGSGTPCLQHRRTLCPSGAAAEHCEGAVALGRHHRSGNRSRTAARP